MGRRRLRIAADGLRLHRSALNRGSICLTVGVLIAGCGQTRSTSAFCGTLHSEKQRILAEFNATSQPGSADQLVRVLSGLGASLQALGELRTYFHKLADVAPDEIKDDAQIVAQDWDQQVQNAGNVAANPLANLAGAFINSMTTSGQLNTLNQFALTNCHESI
jgi:hypothetical protein